MSPESQQILGQGLDQEHTSNYSIKNICRSSPELKIGIVNMLEVTQTDVLDGEESKVNQSHVCLCMSTPLFTISLQNRENIEATCAETTKKNLSIA